MIELIVALQKDLIALVAQNTQRQQTIFDTRLIHANYVDTGKIIRSLYCEGRGARTGAVRARVGRRAGLVVLADNFVAFVPRYPAHAHRVQRHAASETGLPATVLAPLALLGRYLTIVAIVAHVLVAALHAPLEKALAALARRHSVVDAGRPVPAHITLAKVVLGLAFFQLLVVVVGLEVVEQVLERLVREHGRRTVRLTQLTV
ncbi:hypothetical protein BpHYR1_007966 [Brachionus plicatilis]|uniref:Uncharacterized protein n=1 Tax=Brachionus plicatilis TaxID=10195 RepID=A0A3M7RAD3_BRAPC|nr:hypothetical protein BpHYR1_007966 [Brachionus plicatilis]